MSAAGAVLDRCLERELPLQGFLLGQTIHQRHSKNALLGGKVSSYVHTFLPSTVLRDLSGEQERALHMLPSSGHHRKEVSFIWTSILEDSLLAIYRVGITDSSTTQTAFIRWQSSFAVHWPTNDVHLACHTASQVDLSIFNDFYLLFCTLTAVCRWKVTLLIGAIQRVRKEDELLNKWRMTNNWQKMSEKSYSEWEFRVQDIKGPNCHQIQMSNWSKLRVREQRGSRNARKCLWASKTRNWWPWWWWWWWLVWWWSVLPDLAYYANFTGVFHRRSSRHSGCKDKAGETSFAKFGWPKSWEEPNCVDARVCYYCRSSRNM